MKAVKSSKSARNEKLNLGYKQTTAPCSVAFSVFFKKRNSLKKNHASCITGVFYVVE